MQKDQITHPKPWYYSFTLITLWDWHRTLYSHNTGQPTQAPASLPTGRSWPQGCLCLRQSGGGSLWDDNQSIQPVVRCRIWAEILLAGLPWGTLGGVGTGWMWLCEPIGDSALIMSTVKVCVSACAFAYTWILGCVQVKVIFFFI